jgi:SAM-dependent methyltransferase
MSERGTVIDTSVHAKLVELTWDTVAAFLPLSGNGKVDQVMKERLEIIASAAACPSGILLDVGCGDAALLTYLNSVGFPPTRYYGIDVSSKMVEAARRREPRAKFEARHFSAPVQPLPGDRFGAVLFAGSIQFFSDHAQVLGLAASCLSGSPGARVVIAHAQGASFVVQEKLGNPSTVLSALPTSDWLYEHAPKCGLRVIQAPADENPGGLYLAVLEVV